MTQVNSVTENPNGASLTWQSYIDLEETMEWLQIPDKDLNTVKNRLQLLIDMTCTWAQRRIANPIAPTLFNRRFDGWSGWNGAYLQLPYYPVLEVVRVTEWWGSSGPHILDEQYPENNIDGFTMDYYTGQLTRVFPGLVVKPFFAGHRNLEVEWKAGYSQVPADLKVATLEMVAHWWRNTQQNQANSLGGLNAMNEYDPETVANGLWQGTPYRILNLLDSMVHVGIG
jgi:hypothetical protein